MARLTKRPFLSVLCACLLAGCADTHEPLASAEPTVLPQVEETAQFDHAAIQEACDNAAGYIAQQDWSALSAMFAKVNAASYSASNLKSLWNSLDAGDPSSVAGTGIDVRDTGAYGYIVTESAQGNVQADLTFDEDSRILSLRFGMRPADPVISESEEWSETLIHAGKFPQVQGILTVPKGAEDAPVAILLPCDLTSPADASGEDMSFRADLAHLLAERGIASARFDLRQYEDPQMFPSGYEWSYERAFYEDLSAEIHSLENDGVNAGRIAYIANGSAALLGFHAAYRHFEISSALILLNAPYLENGTDLGADLLGESREDAAKAQELLDSDAGYDSAEMVGKYPLAVWQEWKDLSFPGYVSRIWLPVLIVEGKDTTQEDLAGWNSLSNSLRTVYQSENMDAGMRDGDGSLEACANLIRSYLNGEELSEEEVEEKKEKGKS